jgi:hypothetical protein
VALAGGELLAIWGSAVKPRQPAFTDFVVLDRQSLKSWVEKIIPEN